MACCFCNGSRLSNAPCKAVIVAVRFPAFCVTMPPKSIPIAANFSVATLVGLIKEARADFNALAPSDALIPPSFIAVKYKARSLTSPPSPCITGPAFGIASTRSARLVDVWFSTEFKKLIDSASCSVFCLKVVWIARVAFIASCLSTSPRTASLLVSLTEESNSFPVFPVAAMSAASAIVSLKEIP